MAAKVHLSREPLCRECYFRGRVVPAELVNHTVPMRHRPDLRLDQKNLSSMCKPCHDTVIRDLERTAEKLGNILVLQDWLRDPSTRPEGIAYKRGAIPLPFR